MRISAIGAPLSERSQQKMVPEKILNLEKALAKQKTQQM